MPRSGTSGASPGRKSAAAARENNSKVGERHRPYSPAAAASPPPALASRAPVEPGPWSPLGEAAPGSLGGRGSAATPSGRPQKLRDPSGTSGQPRMLLATLILLLLLLGKSRNEITPSLLSPGQQLQLPPVRSRTPSCPPIPFSPCRHPQHCRPQPPGSLQPLRWALVLSPAFPRSPHQPHRPCCRTFLPEVPCRSLLPPPTPSSY